MYLFRKNVVKICFFIFLSTLWSPESLQIGLCLLHITDSPPALITNGFLITKYHWFFSVLAYLDHVHSQNLSLVCSTVQYYNSTFHTYSLVFLKGASCSICCVNATILQAFYPKCNLILQTPSHWTIQNNEIIS